MGIDKETFYDPQKADILPMAFRYPGKGKSGDLPPRPICADTWRQTLFETMPKLQLILLVGQYAQKWHLDKLEKPSPKQLETGNRMTKGYCLCLIQAHGIIFG